MSRSRRPASWIPDFPGFQRWMLLAWVLGSLCPTALAIPSHHSVTQLYHSQWTARDGAPTGIEAMAQTRDGFLWLATSAGLFRFDGVEFERFRGVNGVSLPSQYLYTLFASASGGLWIGYNGGGASYLQDGQLINYGHEQGLPYASVLAFAETPDGTAWLGTTAGLYRREGHQWKLAGADWKLPAETVEALVVDREHTLWRTGAGKIFYLRQGARAFERLPVNLDGIGHTAMTLDTNGSAVYCTYERFGLLRLKAPSEPEAFVPDWDDRRGFPGPWGRCIFDRDGHLWIGTGEGAGRFQLPNETTGSKAGDLQRFRADLVPLAGTLVSGLLEDREGNVWFASTGGLDRFRVPSLINESFGAGANQLGLALAAAPDDDGVWVGTLHGEVFRFREGAREHVPVREVGGLQIDSIYGGRAGNLWLGSGGAIWQLQPDGRWLGSNREGKVGAPDVFSFLNIRAITQDPDGAMWVALARVGTFQVVDGKWTQRTELPTQSPSALFTDDGGRIWFGYLDGEVAVLDGERLTRLEGSKQLGPVNSFAQQNGRIWVASDRGLWRVADARLEPLVGQRGPFTGVTGIAAAPNGELWFGTSEGIVRIASDELQRVLDEHRQGVRHQLLNYLDGLPGPPHAAARNGNRIWFSTMNGIVWTDPARLPRNSVAPNVILKSLIADGTSHDIDGQGPMKLPEKTRNLQISYTATSLTMPERVLFRYRLEDHDTTWQDVGTRREAFFTDLAPGRYHFQVLASNNDGVWNETGASFEFDIPPTFFQSRWFAALWMTVLGLSLWFLYLFRLRSVKARLRMRLEERMVERERIARELHDTFLQGVQGLMLRFQSAMEQIPRQEPSRALMEDALDRADRVLAEGRDAVTDLRTTSEGVSIDLAESLRLLGEELSEESGMRFQLSVDGPSRELDPVVRQESQRIAAEALTNAFHHSQGRRVELVISYARKKFSIRVADDGRGFDPSRSYADHWGLIGMRERAHRMNGRLHIRSDTSGATITLEVFARIAYK